MARGLSKAINQAYDAYITASRPLEMELRQRRIQLRAECNEKLRASKVEYAAAAARHHANRAALEQELDEGIKREEARVRALINALPEWQEFQRRMAAEEMVVSEKLERQRLFIARLVAKPPVADA